MTLKERRRLVLKVCETPLTLGHLRAMTAAVSVRRRAGGYGRLGSMDPELAVLVGLQASGKSTFVAARFAATHTIVSKDLMGSAKHKEARQRRLISEALSRGENVVVDNTNPGPAQWKPLIELAREHGVRAVAYFFPPDADGSVARNAARPEGLRVPDVGMFATLGALRRPRVADGFEAVYLVDYDGDCFTVVQDREGAR